MPILSTVLALSLAGRVFAQVPEADTLATLNLDEVVITGQYEAQSLKKSVYQVRTIDRELIQLRNATNIQTVLNTELGIRFTQDPALGTSDISLMGMSGQNVKILLDGVPLLDRGASKESLNQIDVNSIERIELVEGPMSVSYGTDALAGVINIITKKNNGPRFSVGARVIEESAGNEYQPFHEKGVHNESVNVSGQLGKWNGSAGFTRNNFGGYKMDDLASRWLPKDQTLANGSFGFREGSFDGWYRLNYVYENILTPGQVSNDARVDKEFITNRFTHQAQADWKAGNRWSFNTVASYQDYSRRTRTTRTDLITGDTRLTTDAGSQDKAAFNTEMVRFTSVYKRSPVFSIQSGIDINLSNGSGDRIEQNEGIQDYALFASAEFEPVQKLSLRPGVRFIYNSRYDAPPAVPSVNVKYALSDRLDLRAAYARGFRAPGLRELYFSFFDASHSIHGNPNLKAEFSNSFTSSLVWQAVRNSSVNLKSTLGGFFNSFDNMIDLALDPEDPTGTVTTYVNIYKYKTRGGTLNNQLVWKSWEMNLGGSYIGNYNLYSDDDGALPQLIWTPEVNTTLTYRVDKIGATASIFYKYTGTRSRYNATLDPDSGEEVIQLVTIDPFQWADFTLTKSVGDLITLNAGVKNLFDVQRLASNASGGAHGGGGSVPTGYGRSYFIGLTFQLNKQ
jgi:outer membrane receptor for ferrienterochelin and colicins